MEKVRRLDGNFEVTEDVRKICYAIHANGDIELCTEYDTAYPIVSMEEILKLAEIVRKEIK